KKKNNNKKKKNKITITKKLLLEIEWMDVESIGINDTKQQKRLKCSCVDLPRVEGGKIKSS
ncbi:hypothetical protein, partial [Escherichia coli]|uniref:hypothetical protein n=1 Tax=Escherichia coli TaxID=562 RepID=UPI001BAEA6BD